ncbi:unnamed protein product [Bursaphelenchus okinawaensis]|uniref:Sensory neuron membrane protein 2 n=1 Tax=Bursaphelenchus okinawaensis TaxID=465554 RepID=A0A811KQR4_9BILA|nr:unnamed protein product [Bursaphelenchus okinawaensis]CAG9108541.1 unnamed protein product [Bursaphelenchus okinawaensis]
MFNCNKWKVGQGTTFLVAVIAGVVAAVFYFYVPTVILGQVGEKAILSRDKNGSLSDTTKSWMDPHYDMSMSVYTFSILNSADVEAKNAKLKVLEKGPYVFDEIQHKRASFFENDTRIVYRNYKIYFFNKTKSCSSCFLTDTVTIPNIVLQTIIDKLPDNRILKALVDTLLRVEKEKLFVTTSVGKILFDGYEDELIGKICNSNPIVRSFCRAQKIPLKVGLFYQKNGTDDGTYEIGTGVGDIMDLSKVYKHNGINATIAYYGPKAREIKGTDGQMFPPGLDRRASNYLDIFVGQLCRSIEMERTGSTSYENVEVYTYGPSRNMHDIDLQRANGFCNPNSPRFFNNTYIQESGCAPSGVMDVSSCLPGNPRIYMSQPHFYGSHPAVHDAIDGLKSPSEDDKTELGIEPTASVVVYANQRTQLNLAIINGGLPSLENIQPKIVPLIWIHEVATFDNNTKDQLKTLTAAKRYVFFVSVGTFLCFCFFIVGFGVLFAISSRKQDADAVPLLVDEEPINEGRVEQETL